MRRKKWIPFLFLAPALFFFSVWIIGPTFYTIYLSFTRTQLIAPPEFVGLSNYQFLFSDPIFKQCLVNNFIWVLLYLLIPMPLSLAIAIGLESKVVKATKTLRVIFFVPMAISLVAVGLIWSFMYNPDWGIINTILRNIGLGFVTSSWLGNPNTALYSVIFASYWNFIPFIIIILCAGLVSIPKEVVEAAEIDGAGSFRTLLHITIPLLRPAFVISFAITVIMALRAFAIVFVMTGGGPVNASNVLAVFMFTEAFRNLQLGYGASIAVMLAILTSIFVILYLRYTLKRETTYY